MVSTLEESVKLFVKYTGGEIQDLFGKCSIGKEFARHQKIAKALESGFYFANPYHSWERGLNEHTNGLIRQYLPKDRELLDISKRELAMIQNRLDHRPRKVLGYSTPYEVFMGEFLKVVSA